MTKRRSLFLATTTLLTLLISACVSTETAPSSRAGSEYQIIEGHSPQSLEVPIVLVHGFMGFGAEADTGIGFPYWGGTVDLEQRLGKKGFEVYTADVGPVSSNWDRACELYAYIKGGRVDYGAAHSRKYGHARYGEYYPGVLPEWGTPADNGGQRHTVHLIGHSMGGQTVRLLTELLAYGDSAEIRAAENDPLSGHSVSELFTGGHRWVVSITTIATPHDGTTLTQRFANVGVIEKAFAGLVTHSSFQKEDPLIQLHLQHWSVRKKAHETFEQFLIRAIRHDLWQETEDFSYFDLSLLGAKRLNMRTSTHQDVYYFSWATSRTVSDGKAGHHVPMRGMSLLLHPTARYMGSIDDLPAGIDGAPELWWENDGIVNTCSMDGPSLGRPAPIQRYAKPTPGVWNFMGTLKPLDHLQVSLVLPISGDAPPGYDSLAEFYERWCRFLTSLPEVE